MGCTTKTGKCTSCRYQDGWWAIDYDDLKGNTCAYKFYLDKQSDSTGSGTVLHAWLKSFEISLGFFLSALMVAL